MRSKIEDFDQVERFLDNQMKQEELLQFQENLLKNNSLQARINSVSNARNILNQHAVNQFKQLIIEEEAKYTRRHVLRKNFTISFLILFLLSGSVIFYFSSGIIDKKIKLENISNSVQYVKKEKTTEKLSNNKYIITAPTLNRNKEVTNKDFVLNKRIQKTKLSLDNKEEVKNKKNINPDSGREDVLNTNEVKKDIHLHIKPVVEDFAAEVFKDSVVNIKLPDVCTNKLIEAEIETHAPCIGEKNGKVIVTNITGGKTPFKFRLNDTIVQDVAEFDKLMSGNYNITLVDMDGCYKVFKDIRIDAQNCKKDYEFNPAIGEVWEIPKELGNGNIVIYDAAGVVYYKKKITTERGETWSGIGPSGQILAGYYMFSLDHEDGSVTQGSITIARK